MKRRDFAGLTATTIVGYKTGQAVRSELSYDVPSLVHPHDIEPVIVQSTDNGVDIEGLPKDRFDSLTLTVNQYGNPENVIKEYELNYRDGKHSIELPKINPTHFAYTLYGDSNQFLGESNPLTVKDGTVKEDIDRIPKERASDAPLARQLRRGYFKIDIKTLGVSIPISYQRYEMSSRILGYSKAHEKAKESTFLEETAKRILNSIEADSQIEKIDALRGFIQKMEWKSDFDSKGKLEYIRDPTETFVNLYGDCKDRTVLTVGLLEGGLDIDTSILFATRHMLTGVDIDSLNDKTIEQLENGSFHTYDGSNTTYLPVDSTAHHELGIDYPKPIYAIYRDHYKIRSISGLIDHIFASIPVMINPSGSTNPSP